LRTINKIEKMKTEKELNQDILQLTLEIQERHPELVKYLSELQETLPAYDDPQVNIKYLENYYQSLVEIRDKYKLEHEVIDKQKMEE